MRLEMKPVKLLLLLLLSLSLCLADNESDSDNDVQTQKLLLSFKSSLPDPKPLSTWLPGKSPCNYYAGVSCSPPPAPRVTALDLSSLPLSPLFSSVSTFLFALPNLTSINLKSTNLTGALHPISDCSSSLADLDLSLNALTGSPFSISLVFSACSALTSLNLSSNLLQSTDSDSDAAAPRNYSLSLQSLDLSSNQVVGGLFLPWLLSGGCSHFTNLTVKANRLDGSFSLGGCDSLLHFDVSSNNFSSSMPPLGGCHQLVHLDLSSNKFTGPIGDEIGGCQHLAYLNISSNRFSSSIPTVPTSSLKFVYMSGNQFEGGITSGKGGVLYACPNLVELNLSSNHLSGNIPTVIESCSSLTLLDVSTNNFTGDLPIAMLTRMSGLKKLSLASNNFVGALPGSLILPSVLESLDLSSNNISGKIPSGLCQFQSTHLEELYLQDNLLSGGIPSDLGNCTKLVSIDLSFNYLTGRIPSSLGLLSNLKDLIMWMNLLEGEIPQELMNIRSLENVILDYNRLTGTIPSGLSNCTNLNWISLSSNHLSGVIPSWIGSLANLAILNLSNNSFHGQIPPELGDCRSLLWLDLNSNLLDGPIPGALSKQSGNMAVGLVVGKKYVYLKNDGSSSECPGAGRLLEFAGIRQDSLTRIPTRHSCNFTRIYMGNTQPTFQHNGSMIFLDLSYNKLQDSIPKDLGSMYYLMILDLAHNDLSGPIPSEMGGLKYVGVMDLSYNHLSGSIPPSLAGLTLLSEIDLSNNNLTGMIPGSGQFETFPPNRFYNNSGLCGYPLPRCGPASSAASSSKSERQSKGSLVGSVAMGLLLFLFCIFGVIMLYVELRKRRKKRDAESGSDDDGDSKDGSNVGPRHASWKLTSAREALSINLAAFEKPLRKLTFADLLEATNGFHDDTLIGSGGFGDVYKAKLKDGSVVAIKKLIQISGQGDREFTAEMETIGKIKHRNLVPLLGYCKVKEERLLVYEYMQHGSLDDVLHKDRVKGKGGLGVLNWAARRKIAIGAARGLAFLHHNCIPHIIHRDMKSSNVLVDGNLEARVSDFGMARLMSAMDTHLSVSTLAGTPGYVPPEYYQSFRCSTKGDVYSYGVVLLELLTGRQPTDCADFGDNNNLVGWVKMHGKARPVSQVFDPELLREDPSLEMELLQHLKVACACLDDRPWRRPTMIQVMAMFKEIQAGPPGIHSTTASSVAADDDDTACFTVTGSFSSVDGLAIQEDQENPKLQ